MQQRPGSSNSKVSYNMLTVVQIKERNVNLHAIIKKFTANQNVPLTKKKE